MTSMLRLGSKDRPPFFCRKSGQQNVGNASQLGSDAYDPNIDHLPAISHIDTASLVHLFDRFNKQSPEDNSTTLSQLMDSSTNARDFAWPVGSGMRSAPAGQSMSSPTSMVTSSISNGDGSMASVARNDSTGSSSLSRESDTTPPLTRHSSTSSITPVVSPITPERFKRTEEHLTLLATAKKSVPALENSFRQQRQTRSRTWDVDTSSGLRAPDLDKPLPVRPPGLEYRPSRPATRSRYRRVESIGATHTSNKTKEPVPSLTRFGSLRKHSRSTSSTFPLAHDQSGAQSPGGSPPTSRGARLGKTIAQTSRSSPVRSKSEDLLPGVSMTTRKSYRRSAPEGLAKSSQSRPSLPKQSSKPIAARTAEDVIYRIMRQLDTAQDLQAVAMVSKGFLNTYQRNESKLVGHLIFKTSRPVWELRRSMVVLSGSRAIRLHDYQRDMRAIQDLKAFILDRCEVSCKAKTVAGLLGQDKQCECEVDNALWRIWTFCARFGADASQTPVPPAQIDWLNGSSGSKSRTMDPSFAVGNGSGLSVDELEDMSEMWCCLQALVSQFHGRDAEARRAGVLDNQHPIDPHSDYQRIVEWTAYLLTLGPQIILSLSSGSFDHAKALGLTQWTLPPTGQSRFGFLMAAISQVYQERLLTEATERAEHMTLPSGPINRSARSSPTPDVVASPTPARQPSLRIDTQLHQQRRRPNSVPATAPAVEIRPDCDPDSAQPNTARPNQMHARSVSASATSLLFPASPTADPTIYHSLNITAPANTASVKLGATLFPMDYTPTTPRVPFLATPPPPTRAPPPPPVPGPRIVDPIDKALHLLVGELGFKEANVKRALAMCDSGSGVDVDRAIELLMLESRREAMRTAAPVELPTSTPTNMVGLEVSPRHGPSQPLRRTSKKEYCDGGCKKPDTTVSRQSPATRTERVTRYPSSKSIVRNVSSDNRHALRVDEDAEAHEEDAAEADANTGNTSPITDIYGGHSDDDLRLSTTRHSTVLDDDSSEMWRRREGSDTISPLVSAQVNFRPGVGMGRMSTQSSRKAWKVLGAQQQQQQQQQQQHTMSQRQGRGQEGINANDSPMGRGIKGGLARMRSKSAAGGVVGMTEYAERVERRKSMRMVQAAAMPADRRGTVSVGIGEQLRGLGLGIGAGAGRGEMSGGLGGFRVVEGVHSYGGHRGDEGTMRWMGTRRSVRG